jgi:ribonuclease Z
MQVPRDAERQPNPDRHVGPVPDYVAFTTSPAQAFTPHHVAQHMPVPACAFFLCCLPSLASAAAPSPDFRVHLLGTGNPMPSIGRFGNATLVQAGTRYLLVDAGRGTFLRLGQVAMANDERALLPGVVAASALSVEQLFLTHLHSDHIVGLPDLWLSGWLYREDRPLQVRGPTGTVQLAAHLEKAFEFDVRVRRDTGVRLPGGGARILAHDVAEGVVYEDGELSVTAIRVDHGAVEPA